MVVNQIWRTNFPKNTLVNLDIVIGLALVGLENDILVVASGDLIYMEVVQRLQTK